MNSRLLLVVVCMIYSLMLLSVNPAPPSTLPRLMQGILTENFFCLTENFLGQNPHAAMNFCQISYPKDIFLPFCNVRMMSERMAFV